MPVALTSAESCPRSHEIQCGHHDPECSCAPATKPSSESPGLSLVQKPYFFEVGGLTTPAMCPEPASRKVHGPLRKRVSFQTLSGGAM